MHFEETTRRDISGKFVVSIPFKGNLERLAESRTRAIQRFYSLEKRLDKNETVKKMYQDFIKEYVSLGHMSEISEKVDRLEYFLPHHKVMKEES